MAGICFGPLSLPELVATFPHEIKKRLAGPIPMKESHESQSSS